MAKKDIVTWHPSYSIGIKQIDEQHQLLIKLTNELFSSCLQGQEKTNSVFLKTIHKAVNYINYHFSIEEKIMEKVNYPEYAEHKTEHIDFVREVLIKVDDFTSGKRFTPLAFVYYLRDWVLNHIAVCDKKLGSYIMLLHKQGYLQKITLKVKKNDETNRFEIQ